MLATQLPLLLATLSVFLALPFSSFAQDDLAKNQALSLAQSRFAETFVPSGPNFVTRYTRVIPFGHPADWSLYLYKEVSTTVTADSLTEVDKMNGITWHGHVRYEAKFKRIFLGIEYPDHEKYNGLHADDWSRGGDILDVQLEQRDGKWTIKPGNPRSDFSKPTADDLRELGVALQ